LHLSKQARAFWLAVVLTGFGVASRVLAGWTPGYDEWPRVGLYVVAALVTSGFKVRLPGIYSTLSMNYVFIIAGLIDLHLGAGLLIAAATLFSVMPILRVLRLDVKSPSEVRPWLANPAFAGVVALLVVTSAALTWARNPDWKNDTTLFAADSKHSPNSARVHFLYGNHMLQELKQGGVPPSQQEEYYDIVLSEFRRAIALYPAYAEPHMGIGDAYTYKKDYSSAVRWYAEIVARNPRFGAGFIYLGNAFVSLKDYASAITAFQKAVAIDSNDAGANYLLGTAYRAQGDSARARQYLEKAYALDPRIKQ